MGVAAGARGGGGGAAAPFRCVNCHSHCACSMPSHGGSSAAALSMKVSAFSAVLKAFALTDYSWQKDMLLTQLAQELQIPADQQLALKQSCLADPEVLAVKAALSGVGGGGGRGGGGAGKRGKVGGGRGGPKRAEEKGPSPVPNKRRRP